MTLSGDDDVVFIRQSQRREVDLPVRSPINELGEGPPNSQRRNSPSFLQLSDVEPLPPSSSSSSSSSSSEEEIPGLPPTSSGRVRKPSTKVASQQRRVVAARRQGKATDRAKAERREKATEKKTKEKNDSTVKKLAREQKRRLGQVAKGKVPKKDVSQINTTYEIVIRSSQ